MSDAHGLRRFDAAALARLADAAASAPRARAMLPWHRAADDPLQRFFNLLLHDSYVRPHRHADAGACELVAVIDGALDLLLFDHDARLVERVALHPQNTRAIELPGDVWHGYVVTAPQACLFEARLGPYVAERDKTFAGWAPADDDPRRHALREWLRGAPTGARIPAQLRVDQAAGGDPPAR